MGFNQIQIMKVIAQMKSMPMKVIVFVLFAMLTACGSAPVKPVSGPNNRNASNIPLEQPAAGPSGVYQVQPGDLLLIDVWKEKDLQREILVRPDGGLDFPLIGNVDVIGKTIEQLQKEITTKVAKFVPDPVVSISVKQSLGNKIYVVGKVNKPGEFTAFRNTDVMQALSIAGGLSPFASPNKIKILRRENGVLKTFPFKYTRVEKGEDLDQNIVLQGGDVVVVP